MSPNWPTLVAQGRAKDMGVPWNDEEQEALSALMTHTGLLRNEVAPYVRAGILTVKDYDAETAKEAKTGKSTAHKVRKELEADAKELGVQFTDEVSDAALAKLVTEAKAKPAEVPVEPAPEAPVAPVEEASAPAAEPQAKGGKGNK